MPAATENILVRSVNWLGDAVMSPPALLRLREAWPGARVTLLSPEKLARTFDLERQLRNVDAIFDRVLKYETVPA